MSELTKTTPLGFFDLSSIPVVLTYLFTDPATRITFFCKMAMSGDDAAARQAFYAQPSDEQAKGQHAYYVDLLSRIIVAKPEGLPGFDEWLRGPGTGEVKPSIDEVRDGLRSFLAEPTPMKVKVANDAIESYMRISQPAEFFR